MSEPQGAERRKSKRYAEQVVVQWQRKVSETPTDDWHYTFLRDISRGGLCFEINEPMASGEILFFRIKIHFSLWPFTCAGQVLRVRPLSKPNTYEIGVQFSMIDAKDADLIDLLAWEQEQKKSGPQS